jgi:hypothetical protein
VFLKRVMRQKIPQTGPAKERHNSRYTLTGTIKYVILSQGDRYELAKDKIIF